ncbi:MAG: acylphosphatase [Caldisericia bacterium]|nr:acylphosphatase [Caldisericia bacterium]
MKRIRIRVAGIVQGVGFRYFAKRNAQLLGLSGFTENMDDGSVIIEAQSDNQEILSQYISLIEQGPAHSEVRHTKVAEIPVIEGESFFYVIC